VYKDTGAGELRKEHAGKAVRLAGWVNRRRDHGGLVFIDLRDRSGIAQVVFNPQSAPEAFRKADALRSEWVVGVRGQVALRPSGTENAKLATGEVEVHAAELEVFSESKPPPFYIHEDEEVDETLRMRYRYLYLRRPRMARNLVLRHQIVQHIRNFLDARGFLEVETPILTKSTPEGARDYLVPSRVHPGQFYALPQSPQQLKQLLMVAGVERYFQIARCFRDEDLRADRQPEFTQLDLEMSFVEQRDILDLIEELYTGLTKAVRPDKRVLSPFPRMTYQAAMDRYGSDKPDLRFGMPLTDVSGAFRTTQFQVFKGALAQGGVIKAINAPGCAGYSRRQLDELVDFAKGKGAKGLVYVGIRQGSNLDAITTEDVLSPAARFLTPAEVRDAARKLDAKPGDLLLVVADAPAAANAVLGALRSELGGRLKLADPNLMAWGFVTDFPLFEWNAEEKRWNAAHHPFTAPHPDDLAMLESEPAKVRSQAYDLVCNGLEIASGSIRIHQPELQARIFKVLGYTPEETQEKFGHLLEAFSFGAPPHGGIAPGIDRTAMLLADELTLREVIAFPKTQAATDLLLGSPSPVAPEQLRQVHLRVLAPPQGQGPQVTQSS
jgi:aspartyl-tRNA synthetase